MAPLRNLSAALFRLENSRGPAELEQVVVALGEYLLRSQPNRAPRLSREGQARIAVLGYCDGQRTAREIEEAVLREHPNLFPSTDEISRFVARALGRDTE
ncbi:MAG: hypothetical protein U1F70_17180 [Candidatus Competibacteraceae bacterium]